ncbi:MAG: endonuclease/exonuclease/phosphatase family protein [Treponema sp.]|nr:endonuclease/exonuclease/phosphatase family protein [Treponema sp.]
MKRIFKVIFTVLIFLSSFTLASLIILLTILTLLEYRPKEREDVSIRGSAQKEACTQSQIKILSWNIGYADLADYADFFMDGGKHVQNSSKSQVLQNLEAFVQTINSIKPDAVLLQEVDLCSTRSFKMNQVEFISSAMKDFSYSFAYNFKAAFVPFPLPPIGHVESGLLTLSSFYASSAQRLSLLVPFKWPVRTANLKRCLLVSRIPFADSNRELVLVNLHLEAFDSGEGKIEQTKKLKDFILAEYAKGNYVVAGGDFNQTFSNSDISFYYQKPDGWKPGSLDIADFPEGWTLLQDPAVPSCRSNGRVYKNADKKSFQFFCIDGFILSPNVSALSVKTIDLDFAHSDHNPVLLTCSLLK